MYNSDIAIASMFRDSQVWHGHKINHVEQFFSQIYSQNIYGDIFCLEGHSSDNTYEELKKHQIKNKVFLFKDPIKSKTAIESTGIPARMEHLNRIGNFLLSKIYKYKQYKYILWIESDIIIPNNTQLIQDFINFLNRIQNCGIIAPLVITENENSFYDGWGFSGKNLDELKKCIPQKDKFYHKYRYQCKTSIVQIKKCIEMDTIGTCGMFRGNLKVNFGNECFRGLCKNIKEKGYSVFVDPSIKVYHPLKIGRIKDRCI